MTPPPAADALIQDWVAIAPTSGSATSLQVARGDLEGGA
jgi:hypothetical protein